MKPTRWGLEAECVEVLGLGALRKAEQTQCMGCVPLSDSSRSVDCSIGSSLKLASMPASMSVGGMTVMGLPIRSSHYSEVAVTIHSGIRLGSE